MEKEEVYTLEVRIPKQDSFKHPIYGDTSLGSDTSCDIRITDHGVAPLQARFHIQNNILSMTNLGPKDSLKIGSTKCGHGRMYILEKGDKCSIDKIKIIVKKEKVIKEDQRDLNLKEKRVEENNQESLEDASETIEEVDPDNDETSLYTTEESHESYEEEEDVEALLEQASENNNEKKVNKTSKISEFFSKLKAKFKKEGTNKKQPVKAFTKKKERKITGKKIISPIPGPLLRFIGVFYNIIFFLVFLGFIFPLIEEGLDFKLSGLTGPLFDSLSPYLKKISLSLPEDIVSNVEIRKFYTSIVTFLTSKKFIHYLILYICYDILFNLIIGIGLGQISITMVNNGHPLLKRLLSPIRVLLNVISPFTLFLLDIPALINKKTVKETITASRYGVRRTTHLLGLALFIYPILFVSIYNFPIFFDLVSGKNTLLVSTSKLPITPIKPSKKEQFSVKTKSLFLEVSGSIFTSNDILFVPLLKKNKLTLLAYKKNKNIYTTIEKNEKFLEVKKVTDLLKKDPLLFFTHQDLFTMIQNNEEIQKGEQLNDILFTMLSFNIENFIEIVKDHGIFLTPYFEGKSLIYQRLASSKISQINWLTSRRKNIIEFIGKEKNGTNGLVFINNDYFSVIKLKHSKKGRSFGNTITNRVFYHNSLFKGSYGTLWKTQSKKEDILSKSLLSTDIFYHLKKSQEKISETEAAFIVNTYMAICYESLKVEDDDLQDILLNNFKDMEKSLITLTKINKDPGLKELRIGLNRIQKALYKRDYKFFKANL